MDAAESASSTTRRKRQLPEWPEPMETDDPVFWERLEIADRDEFSDVLKGVLKDIKDPVARKKHAEMLMEKFQLYKEELLEEEEYVAEPTASVEEIARKKEEKHQKKLQEFSVKLAQSRISRAAEQLIQTSALTKVSSYESAKENLKKILKRIQQGQKLLIYHVIQAGELIDSYKTKIKTRMSKQQRKQQLQKLISEVGLHKTQMAFYIQLYKLNVQFPGLSQVSLPLRELAANMVILREVLETSEDWKRLL